MVVRCEGICWRRGLGYRPRFEHLNYVGLQAFVCIYWIPHFLDAGPKHHRENVKWCGGWDFSINLLVNLTRMIMFESGGMHLNNKVNPFSQCLLPQIKWMAGPAGLAESEDDREVDSVKKQDPRQVQIRPPKSFRDCVPGSRFGVHYCIK